jgi:NADH-quinone oxidoreductase subunit C
LSIAVVDQLILDRGVTAGDEWITVAPERVPEALRALRQQGFQTLSFLTAVDHIDQVHTGAPTPQSVEQTDNTPTPARFELVYQLRSIQDHRTLRVRTFPTGEFPAVHTVSDIYPNANWDEREVYDLFGVKFEGHPDLVRILLPDDWVGHPLRRDYPMGGEPVDFSDDQETWHTTPAPA